MHGRASRVQQTKCHNMCVKKLILIDEFASVLISFTGFV